MFTGPPSRISELAWLGTEVGVEHGEGTFTTTMVTGTSRVGWNGAMGMAGMGTGMGMVGMGGAKVTVGTGIAAMERH